MRLVPSRKIAALALGGIAAVTLAACGGDSDESGSVVVATTPIMASIAEEVVGDGAEVRTILPEGADPHDYQPSARDVASLGDATLIVTNGEDLEEGLESSIESTRSDGVPVFTATEHVALLSGEGEEEDAEEERAHGASDPHIFADPRRMAQVALALGAALRAEGVEVGDAPEAAAARLRALDREVAARVAALPAAERRVVTGHESMAYYADRYGFEVVAAAIPNLSTGAQVSAADVADVIEVVEREGAPAIFTEPGTAQEAAEVIADATGAEAVIVHTESFGPGVATYEQYVRALTEALVTGLGGG